MLTKNRPIVHKVEGREFDDVYVEPGEPIGVRNLCDAIINLIEEKPRLERGQTILVDLNCSLIV